MQDTLQGHIFNFCLSGITFFKRKNIGAVLWVLLISTFSLSMAFANDLTSDRDNYATDDPVWLELADVPSNAQDWIGIYPAGATTAWNNVIAWRWASDTSQTQVDEGNWYQFPDINIVGKQNEAILPSGNYIARFFLNNSFTVENSVSFSVGGAQKSANIRSYKANYPINDKAWIELENAPGNDQDWIGIYPAGESNAWGNVVAWKWASDTNPKYDDDWYLFDLAAGHYTARFFLNNSFTVEDSVDFSVGNGIKEYGNLGGEEVGEYVRDDYTIYYAKNKTAGAAVVVLLPGHGGEVNNYDGLARFIASHGYYVIGPNSDGGYEATIQRALKNIAVSYDHVDASKIGIIGHSLGGSYAFHMLKALKGAGYATNSHFIISLDGWFAINMQDNDMDTLNTTSLIMQFGGANGIQGNFGGKPNFQDPRINMTLYQLLKGDEKALSLIEANNDHGYVNGDLESLLPKKDLLRPIHALLEYKFKSKNVAKNGAKNIALRDQYNDVVTYDKETYDYKCYRTINGRNYNYCNP